MAHSSAWESALLDVLGSWSDDSDGVVISADVDGLLSVALLAGRFPVRVVGAYTTTHLVLLDGATSEDAARALWLDHDVSEPGVRCVGQHLVHHKPEDELPRREPQSYNPNVWERQAWSESFRGRSGTKRDKYPYGTCHFIAHALGYQPSSKTSPAAALLAHADGTWRTVVDYAPNARIWANLMFGGNDFIDYLQDEWHSSSSSLDAHRVAVTNLLSVGVSATPSRAKIAALLPDELRALTGRQSIRYSKSNPQVYADRIRAVLRYVADAIGTNPSVGHVVTDVITGVVETPYPDRIDSLDAFMDENEVFSHAFTDFRTLRFTRGIQLRG